MDFSTKGESGGSLWDWGESSFLRGALRALAFLVRPWSAPASYARLMFISYSIAAGRKGDSGRQLKQFLQRGRQLIVVQIRGYVLQFFRKHAREP